MGDRARGLLGDGDAWRTCRTTTRAAACTAGARTASWACAIARGALLRAGAVERRRSDLERAAVRRHRPGGEPRRGRQGAVLLPRRDADAFVLARALPIPAARLSVRAAGRGERAPHARRPRVRDHRHRRLRRRPLLRRDGRARQGRPRRSVSGAVGRQPRPGRGDAGGVADALVPQHVVLGARRRGLPAARTAPLDGGGQRDGGRRRAPDAGALPLRRRAGGRRGPRADLHRERDERRTAVRGAQSLGVLQGRLPRVRRAAATAEAVNPSRWGTKMAAVHSPGDPGGRRGAPAHAPDGGHRRERRRAARALRRLRLGDDGAPERGGRLLRREDRSAEPGRAHGRATGLRGAAVVAAVLRVRRAHLAGRRPVAARAAAGAQRRAERRLDASLQPRRHLDAGQVGVPLVRVVGPGVPHAAVRAHRPVVRDGPADPVHARVVHAPERAAAGL